MKALHLSVSLSRAAGGIFEIELAIARHLEARGVEVDAFGLEDEEWSLDAGRWAPVPAEVFQTKGPRGFGYAPRLLQRMVSSQADVAHLHYMWMYPSVAIRRWAAITGRPYLVTPNGMLEPWALRNSAWKKQLAGLFYENRMLHGAACLQANTEKELTDIRAYGLKNPIAVIPNGVEVPETNAEALKHERKTLLFLGRLHPKKGLVNALRAWAEVRGQRSEVRGQDDWQFIIAGWDQGGHEADLKRLCNELGLSYSDIPASDYVGETPTLPESSSVSHLTPLGTSGRARRALPTDLRPLSSDLRPPASVIFTGPAFGETKDRLLRQASAFILPSFSEGLPMSVLEAWAYRLPVLMTDHCNLPEGFAANAALHIGTDVASIAEGMRDLLRSPTSDLRSLGDNGRALVERQFTWPQVAGQMKEVYDWVLGGGPKPGCVQ